MDNKTIIKHYTQPAFLVCVITLIVAIFGMKSLISAINPYFIKLPLPLKKSFDDIDQTKISPYQVVRQSKITNKDILEALGTDEYIQWELMDTEEPANSPTRYCSLFITYYTGIPDQVPHVPEECYTGGGAQQLNRPSDYEIAGVPVRALMFTSKKTGLWTAEAKFNVFYFFKVNGHYAGSRDSARFYLQTNIASKYSYFSKVEWKFYNVSGLGAIYPDEQEAVKASQKLMETILPVLEQEHFPDWEKANSQTEQE